jgi:hypothetical protein
MTDMSVSADYTRYRGGREWKFVAHITLMTKFGIDIADTLTIERSRKPGAAFERRMLRSVLVLSIESARSHTVQNGEIKESYCVLRHITEPVPNCASEHIPELPARSDETVLLYP